MNPLKRATLSYSSRARALSSCVVQYNRLAPGPPASSAPAPAPRGLGDEQILQVAGIAVPHLGMEQVVRDANERPFARRVAGVRAQAAEAAALIVQLPPCRRVLLVRGRRAVERFVAARQFLPCQTVFGLQRGDD